MTPLLTALFMDLGFLQRPLPEYQSSTVMPRDNVMKINTRVTEMTKIMGLHLKSAQKSVYSSSQFYLFEKKGALFS